MSLDHNGQTPHRAQRFMTNGWKEDIDKRKVTILHDDYRENIRTGDNLPTAPSTLTGALNDPG